MRLMSFQCVLCGFPLVLILFLSLHQSSAQIIDTPADTAAPGELGYSSDDAPVEDASTAAEVAAPAAPPPRGFASVSSIPWLQKPCHLNCKKWTIVGSGKITMEEYRTIDSADGCVAWFSKLRKYMAGNKISLLVSRHAEEREGWSRIPTNTPLQYVPSCTTTHPSCGKITGSGRVDISTPYGFTRSTLRCQRASIQTTSQHQTRASFQAVRSATPRLGTRARTAVEETGRRRARRSSRICRAPARWSASTRTA
ncbi:hypothetical protein NFJ02_10g02850 [Pycnococcus provasolii]